MATAVCHDFGQNLTPTLDYRFKESIAGELYIVWVAIENGERGTKSA